MFPIKPGCQLLPIQMSPLDGPKRTRAKRDKSENAISDANKNLYAQVSPGIKLKRGQDHHTFNTEFKNKISLKQIKGSEVRSVEKMREHMSPSHRKNGESKRQNKANNVDIQPINLAKLQTQRLFLSDRNENQNKIGYFDGEIGSARKVKSSLRKNQLAKMRNTMGDNNRKRIQTIIRYDSANENLSNVDPEADFLRGTCGPVVYGKLSEIQSSEHATRANDSHAKIQKKSSSNNIQKVQERKLVSGLVNQNYKNCLLSPEAKILFQSPSQLQVVTQRSNLPLSPSSKQKSVQMINFKSGNETVQFSRKQLPENRNRITSHCYQPNTNFLKNKPILPESPQNPKKQSPNKIFPHNVVFNFPQKNTLLPIGQSLELPQTMFKAENHLNIHLSPNRQKFNSYKSTELISNRQQQVVRVQGQLANFQKNVMKKAEEDFGEHQLVNSQIFITKLPVGQQDQRNRSETMKQFEKRLKNHKLPTSQLKSTRKASNTPRERSSKHVDSPNKVQTFRPFHKNASKNSNEDSSSPKIVINTSPDNGKMFKPLTRGTVLSPKMTESQTQPNDDVKSQRSSSSIVIYGVGELESSHEISKHGDFWTHGKIGLAPKRISVAEESMIDPDWKRNTIELGSPRIQSPPKKVDFANFQGRKPVKPSLQSTVNSPKGLLPPPDLNNALWKMNTINSVIGPTLQAQRMSLNYKL